MEAQTKVRSRVVLLNPRAGFAENLRAQGSGLCTR